MFYYKSRTCSLNKFWRIEKTKLKTSVIKINLIIIIKPAVVWQWEGAGLRGCEGLQPVLWAGRAARPPLPSTPGPVCSGAAWSAGGKFQIWHQAGPVLRLESAFSNHVIFCWLPDLDACFLTWDGMPWCPLRCAEVQNKGDESPEGRGVAPGRSGHSTSYLCCLCLNCEC